MGICKNRGGLVSNVLSKIQKKSSFFQLSSFFSAEIFQFLHIATTIFTDLGILHPGQVFEMRFDS